MKKTKQLAVFIMLILVFIIPCAYAKENQYTVIKELVYTNNRGITLENAFVEITIGQTDFTKYTDDIELKITPTPDEIREDEYGNQYAYYNLKGMNPDNEFKVTIERTITTKSFNREENIMLDTELVDDVYLNSQTRVDSENELMKKKAKQITRNVDTNYDKALKIFEYVNTYMEYDTNPLYANRGSLSALNSERGVCEEFATLYAALCRAVDIPTKVVEGYKLDLNEETGKYELINHVWCEIFIEEEGWMPVEPTVIYILNGERTAYEKSFCNIIEPEYIALGIYNYDKANRVMQSVEERSFKETLIQEDNENIPPIERMLFEDINENYSWSIDAITNLYDLGIVKGYSEKEYGPDKNISRIEFICMLSRTLKSLGTISDNSGLVYYYLDYNQEHWSKEDYDYLMRCYQAITPSDITSAGYYNIATVFENNLKIDEPITREEVVALLDAFMDEEEGTENIFSDISDSKFKDSIIKSYANDMIMGYPDGTFKPKEKITRAEMAVILDRYIGNQSYVVGGSNNV